MNRPLTPETRLSSLELTDDSDRQEHPLRFSRGFLQLVEADAPQVHPFVAGLPMVCGGCGTTSSPGRLPFGTHDEHGFHCSFACYDRAVNGYDGGPVLSLPKTALHETTRPYDGFSTSTTRGGFAQGRT